MRFIATIKILGTLLMILSISMLPPIGVGLYYGDGAINSFVFAFFVTVTTGFIMWAPCRRTTYELKPRDGFMIVALFWVVLSFFSAIPLMVTLYPKLSFTDAVFEAVSGLTTTGATVLAHLQRLPHAMLYYRQQLHLFGGIGIIVLAVAILPMLGIGGMQLYRAEIAGPNKTSKLTPRITQTAKALWYIYFGLALACALAYHFAGMTWFDAVGESFSTVSTGGFSLHDSSLAYYKSEWIDVVAIVFMLLGAINFSLHFHFFKYRRLSAYFKDPEFIGYIRFLLVISIIVALVLIYYDYYHIHENVLNAVFTVVSLSSTTGLTTTNFSIWPSFLPFLLMFVALVGGCAGSTSGGLKIIRCLMLKEQSKREFHRLIHPKAISAVKLGKQTLSENTIQAIWGFVSIFVALFAALFLLLIATGLDVTTAFGSLAACISNSGAGIGKIADNFAHINSNAKWILIFSMITGRLEIFTVMILLMPSYWKR
jgi:trk system potassium uptake protein TrkH